MGGSVAFGTLAQKEIVPPFAPRKPAGGPLGAASPGYGVQLHGSEAKPLSESDEG